MLYPAILLFCCIGVYSIHNNPRSTWCWRRCFGGFGFLCSRLRCEPAPLLLGFILGPMIEETFAPRALISHGDPLVFVQRPISLCFLILAFCLLIVLVAPMIQVTRREAFEAEGVRGAGRGRRSSHFRLSSRPKRSEDTRRKYRRPAGVADYKHCAWPVWTGTF